MLSALLAGFGNTRMPPRLASPMPKVAMVTSTGTRALSHKVPVASTSQS